jgi:hypothetical protein
MAPGISPGWLVVAAFALDLLWPMFFLAGLERVTITPGATAFNPLVFDSYPWSHSLLMAFAWALGAMAIARWRGMPGRVTGLVGAVVVSHWILDYIVHVPDLPLWPGRSPLVGLGLWNSIPGTLVVEGALYLFGIAMYVLATKALDRVGSYGFWALVLVSAIVWALSPWSRPPASAGALAAMSLGLWLVAAWAAWADRHRSARAAS